MITVVAKLQAQEGKQAELRQALTEMVEAVSANEPGVSAYSLQVADDDPTLFLFYEQHESAEAQKTHGGTEHMQALGGKLQDLLAGRPEIARYTQISGIER